VAEFVEAFGKPKFQQEITAKQFCNLQLIVFHIGLKLNTIGLQFKFIKVKAPFAL